MLITKELLQKEFEHFTKQLVDAKGQVLVIESALSVLGYFLRKLDEPDMEAPTL